MRLIFLGPPGVGKGTHAEDVAKHYGIPKISTGDIFREEMKKGTELGKKVAEFINRGELVPDDITIKILQERISKPDCAKGFILDGFPRTIPQAEALDKIAKIDLVINFTASKEVIIERISGRLTCRKCGAIFHKTSKGLVPKKPGICDYCGGELYQREDQKPEAVKRRLEVYEEQTKPLIDYYRKKGILVDFNAEGEKEEVSKRLFELLEEKLG